VDDANETCGVKEGKGREGERNGKGNTEMPPSSGNELMLANWLLEEANVPADNGTRRVAADAIRLLAKEGGTTHTAAQFILEAAVQAVADGDTINRFWFTDKKYKPQKPVKTKREKQREQQWKDFMSQPTEDGS
jgi:hypothetical protein